MRQSPGTCILVALLAAAAPVTGEAQRTEYVYVQKVMDDNAVIVRSDGAVYLIEKGVGCLSLWRYEGKRVLISSPGLFLGVGSRLLIPDLSQECRLWDAKHIDAAAPGTQQVPPTDVPLPLPSRYTDELSLYDAQGRATAYFEPSAALTLYLWTGEAVAYLVDDSIYGFNGKHLGWYRNGIIYDHEGSVVAAPAAAFRGSVEPAPPRSVKQLRPLKGLKELKPLRPLFGLSWSSLPARVFFLMGVD